MAISELIARIRGTGTHGTVDVEPTKPLAEQWSGLRDEVLSCANADKPRVEFSTPPLRFADGAAMREEIQAAVTRQTASLGAFDVDVSQRGTRFDVTLTRRTAESPVRPTAVIAFVSVDRLEPVSLPLPAPISLPHEPLGDLLRQLDRRLPEFLTRETAGRLLNAMPRPRAPALDWNVLVDAPSADLVRYPMPGFWSPISSERLNQIPDLVGALPRGAAIAPELPVQGSR